MRTHWAEMQNAALEKSGAIDRVDHRSLEAQREEAEQERDKLQERESAKIERQKLEREKQEREQDRDVGLGYGF